MRLLGRDIHDLSEIDELRLGWLLSQSAEHSKSGRTQHWKITAKSRGGVVLWIGNIHDEIDAWRFWHRLQNNALGYQDYIVPQPAYCPSIREIEGVIYEFATVTSFTATGSTSFNPTTPVILDYLVLGAGSGGNSGTVSVVYGYGGSAGIIRGGTVKRPPGSYNVVVGAGSPGVQHAASTAGGSSVFDTITATGGNGVSNAGGGNGGSNADFSGGASSGTSSGAGAGSGQSASGFNAGNGVTSTITGATVVYGGGGAGINGTGPAAGTPGTGGGGAASTSAGGSSGAANKGAGGGGCGDPFLAGAGGSGVVVLSWTPIVAGFNMPMLGM